jgi:hypothetical protein
MKVHSEFTSACRSSAIAEPSVVGETEAAVIQAIEALVRDLSMWWN